MITPAIPEWFAPSMNVDVIYKGVSDFGPQTPEVIAMLLRIRSATVAELASLGSAWRVQIIYRRQWVGGLDRTPDSTVEVALRIGLAREWGYAAHCARWMVGYREDFALVAAGEAVQAVVLRHNLEQSRYEALIAPWVETFGG